jgi:hypothetical protein
LASQAQTSACRSDTSRRQDGRQRLDLLEFFGERAMAHSTIIPAPLPVSQGRVMIGKPTITDCNQKDTARQTISRVQTVGDLASLQYGLRDSRISTGTCPAGSSKRVMLASVPAHIANGSSSRLAPPQRQAVQVLLHSQNLWKTLWIQLYGTG